MSILPPIRIEFVEKESEHVTGSLVPMHLKMTTFLPEEGEEVMFTSCSDVPYEIKLSDEENFEVINRSSRFNKHIVLRDAEFIQFFIFFICFASYLLYIITWFERFQISNNF